MYDNLASLQPDRAKVDWLDRQITVGCRASDESLDPEVRPAIEGRYRFTLGHEGGGHWRLHRPLVEANRCPAPFRTHRAGPQADGAGRCRPTEPHWYLSLIGVEALHRKKGCGAALLRHGLHQCDREHRPAIGSGNRHAGSHLCNRRSSSSADAAPACRPQSFISRIVAHRRLDRRSS
jgi:GNAT superfamily N-acetyltransferase